MRVMFHCAGKYAREYQKTRLSTKYAVETLAKPEKLVMFHCAGKYADEYENTRLSTKYAVEMLACLVQMHYDVTSILKVGWSLGRSIQGEKKWLRMSVTLSLSAWSWSKSNQRNKNINNE